jgi:hypothetical protein
MFVMTTVRLVLCFAEARARERKSLKLLCLLLLFFG